MTKGSDMTATAEKRAIPLSRFIAQNGITAKVKWTDSNPNMEGMPEGSRHFVVTLKRGRHSMSVPFSQGPAHEKEPTAEDVLDCLASDTVCASSGSFRDFCADMGYDEDSRRAKRIFDTICEQDTRLKRFLGDSYMTLLYDTERL